MHLPPGDTMAVPVAVARDAAPRMSRARLTQVAGLIADDQRLFTPSAQVTPMTCKKAVFACLDTDQLTLPSPPSTAHRVLYFDCVAGETSSRLRGAARAGHARGATRKVRIVRTFAAILNRPLPPPSHIK